MAQRLKSLTITVVLESKLHDQDANLQTPKMKGCHLDNSLSTS